MHMMPCLHAQHMNASIYQEEEDEEDEVKAMRATIKSSAVDACSVDARL